ncbi:UNVERIFIED_CONTAM: hypothetical protein Sindi_2121600 [Sesamum indicum]
MPRLLSSKLRSQLEQKLADITQKFQKATSAAKRDHQMDLEAGKQEAFMVGSEAGIEESRLTFLQSSEYKDALTQARLHGARDFMKTPAFNDAVETKAADFMIMGFEKCQSQIQKLNGYVEGFDRAQLNHALDGNLGLTL